MTSCTMTMALLAVAATLLLAVNVASEQIDYCVTGYLMDRNCIKGGKLFDNPTLDALSHPMNHSVECLIDMPECLASGYDVLVEGSGVEYQRMVNLAADSSDMLLEYARALGVCPSCSGSGTTERGLRATVLGTIDSDARFDPKNPPVMKVTTIEPDSIVCSRSAEGPNEVFDGSDYCVVGYLMDKYCITSGVLFDNPTLDTLSYPQNHSVHCLLDVPECLASGYEVLIPGSGLQYQRAVSFDTSELLLEYARQYGVCPSCTGAGTIEVGLQATVKGTIVPSTANNDIPTLRVTSVETANVGCRSLSSKNGKGGKSKGSVKGAKRGGGYGGGGGGKRGYKGSKGKKHGSKNAYDDDAGYSNGDNKSESEGFRDVFQHFTTPKGATSNDNFNADLFPEGMISNDNYVVKDSLKGSTISNDLPNILNKNFDKSSSLPESWEDHFDQNPEGSTTRFHRHHAGYTRGNQP